MVWSACGPEYGLDTEMKALSDLESFKSIAIYSSTNGQGIESILIIATKSVEKKTSMHSARASMRFRTLPTDEPNHWIQNATM